MYCTNHPTKEATLQCTQCAAFWCPDCPRKVGLGTHVVCATCGSALTGFAPQRSIEAMFVRSVRRASSREGLVAAAAFGAFYGLLSWMHVIPIIYLGTLVIYYFIVVHHVGAGGEGLPTAGESADNWGEIRGAAFGGLFCALLGFAPLIAMTIASDDPLPGRLVFSLLLVGQLYMPAVVIAIAVTSSAWSAIWPLAWVRVVARAPSAYVRFAALWIITVMIGVAIAWVSLLLPSLILNRGGGSMILNGACAFVWSLFWFFQASLVGEYIRGNAAAFGWAE